MKNKYDNALTILNEKNEIDNTLLKLHENLNKLESLDNLFLTESKKIILEVSLWNNVKYYLGKLGRYKAGGKILGKGKIDQEAGAKIQKILDKKGNELLSGLHDEIKKTNAKDKGEFPNNRDPEIFLNIVLMIAEVYDSIVAATKKKLNEEGYLPIDMANALILDLREYVKKYLDVDVNWVNSIMDSEEESKQELILDSDEIIDEDRSSDVRAKLQAKGGDEKIDSERMKTLKSWKLPLALIGAGASFGALSWMIEWIFPPEVITTYTPESFVKAIPEEIGSVSPGDGFTQTLNAIPQLGTDLNPGSSPNEVIEALSKLGNGNAKLGAEIITQQDGIFRDPELARATLTELVNNPNGHGDTLKDVFDSKGDWAGTGKSAGDTLVTQSGGTIKMMLLKSFTRWVAKKTVVTSAKAVILGPLLAKLGIVLFGAGVLVKLMREKGKRQSRAKTLNDLLQSLQLIKQTENNPIIIKLEPTTEIPEPTNNKPAEGGGDEVKTNTGVPSEFLQGNRNTQLAYLSSNFLPEGSDFWSNLKIKQGTSIPSGFLDASLGQGKSNPEKYLTAYHKFLKEKGLLTQDLNVGAWLALVKSKKNQSLIKWVRNTRKGIGNFINAMKKTFPDFEIGDRQKAKVTKPGKEGQAMGIAGESLNGRFDLILEVTLGDTASQAGFDEGQFMKNLPQFMEMISSMYYSVKGDKLSYNKQAVLDKCKKYGCKGGSGKKLKRTKSPDYKFVESFEPLKEEINKIKKLMK